MDRTKYMFVSWDESLFDVESLGELPKVSM